jgi:hypothetical protein
MVGPPIVHRIMIYLKYIVFRMEQSLTKNLLHDTV